MTDPTGTKRLRDSFEAEAKLRLGRVRSLTHTIMVEHDLMHARNDPLAQFLPHPGHRLAAFAEWFARTVDQQLLAGGWWEKYLQRAWQSGITAGGELVRSLPPSNHAPVPAVYGELARRELAGIVAALVQQVSRQAATAAIGRRKPLPMYQQVLTVLKKIGMVRLKAFINFMVVKLHNAARLEQFRVAGITRIGIVPERLEPHKPSRFLRHDHAMVHDQESPLVGQVVVEAKQKRWRKRLAELVATHGEAIAAQLLQQEIAAEVAQLTSNVAAFKARLGAETEAFVARRQAEGAAVEAARQEREAKPEGDVDVMTAGDELVCPECEGIALSGPYTLGEAEDLIPAHPNCRCTIVPAGMFSEEERLGESG